MYMLCRRPYVRTCLWTFWVLILIAAPATAGDRYYSILFGSQSDPKRAKHSHTFGCVIKATGEGCDRDQYALEVYTISWMPADMQINTLRFIPEAGKNLSLRDTIAWTQDTNQNVAYWGPFELYPKSFYRVMARINDLESGRVKYQCIDPLLRTQRITDCIHAISDIDPKRGRFRYPLIRFGKAATEHIVHEILKHGANKNPCCDHSWVARRMGLDQCPFDHRVHHMKRPWKQSPRVARNLNEPPEVPCKMPLPDFVIAPGETANVCPDRCQRCGGGDVLATSMCCECTVIAGTEPTAQLLELVSKPAEVVDSSVK